MRKRRKTTTVDGRTLRSKSSFVTLTCSNKGCTREVQVDNEVVSVICWECVQKKVGIDPKYLQQQKKVVKKTPEGFPRGWHLYAKFVHEDGRVFEKGVENETLKGSLPPTEVKVNTLTRTQRRRIREEKKAKKEAKLAKRYEKKMKAKEKL